MTNTEQRPADPINPGPILVDELQELNMSAAELARQLHVPSTRLVSVISPDGSHFSYIITRGPGERPTALSGWEMRVVP